MWGPQTKARVAEIHNIHLSVYSFRLLPRRSCCARDVCALKCLVRMWVLNFENRIRWLGRGSRTWRFCVRPRFPHLSGITHIRNCYKIWKTLKHKYDLPASLPLSFPSMPKSRGASNPVYLHKQSPTQLLWQKQLNLSCFVSTWFLLSLWLFACLRTIEAGEWQQIVGMHLNETNYYMLTAFTMADLKELGSFNLAPQDSL